jgi:hypothetical protein
LAFCIIGKQQKIILRHNLMCGQKTTNRQRIVEIIDKYNKTATYDNYHIVRNACTKSGSLRFSQFSGC